MIVQKLILKEALRLITKKFKLNKVLNYVEQPNELDDKSEELENRIKILESIAHPQREFVRCSECNLKIKENKC